MRIALVLLVLALCAAVPAGGATRPRCERHRAHALARSGQALVFAVLERESDKQRVYGCLRPRGAARPWTTTYVGSLEYGSDAYFNSLQVTGAYAAGDLVTGTEGAIACSKAQADDCPQPEHAIEVLAVASGRRLSLPSAVDITCPVLVSVDGVVAWISGYAPDLRLNAAATAPGGSGKLVATPAELDRGAIDPASLRLDGHTVSWTTAGVAHTATETPQR